jgi:hypothetical protein
MLPQVPAVIASRVQHVPFMRNVGNGQDVVVVVGQFPSLLRGLPSGQADTGVCTGTCAHGFGN